MADLIEESWGDIVLKREPYSTTEEQLLAAMIQRDGPAKHRAIELLVEANTRFALTCACKYGLWNNKEDVSNLFREAMYGLFEAARRFRRVHAKGKKGPVKFTSYAVWFIRMRIQRSRATTSKPYSLPKELFSNLSGIKRWEQKFFRENQREPAPDEYPVDPKDPRMTYAYQMYKSPHASLDKRIGTKSETHGERKTLADFIPADGEADELALDNNLKDVVASLLDQYRDYRKARPQTMNALVDRDIKIIRDRFGIGENRAKILEEIGKEHGITREAVRQIVLKFVRAVRTRDEFRWFREEIGSGA